MICPGTKVLTVEIENPSTDWTAEAHVARRFGMRGMVIGHHDSHGLCYVVAHFRSGREGGDSSIGCYDPEELKVLEVPAGWISK